MKLLSVTIPCYNSGAYMRRAVDSLLSGGEDLEILIVDDGSKDDTGRIADEYERIYPEIVRVIHQENGGHGEAVNTGLKNARGLYFKVVDSDDWVSEKALAEMMKVLRDLTQDGRSVDMVVANYVYDKVGEKRRKVISYRTALPQDRVFGWDDVMHFHQGQYILMHSAIYRTKLLLDCGLKLPAHTFYVDNIFVYQPLPYVKTLYYLNVNLYHYFIGREDQSVNEKIIMERIDQQLKVNRIIIESHNLSQIKNKKLKNYMTRYLSIMMTVSSVYLIKKGDAESFAKRDELWQFLKEKDKKLYRRIRSNVLGVGMNCKTKLGRKVVEAGYFVSRKIFKFG